MRRCSPRWRPRRCWPPTRPRSTCWTRPRSLRGRRERRRPGGEGEGGGRRAARADRPHPRRAADLAAGHRLPAQGRRRRRDPGRVRRVPDHRRLHRLPAPAVAAGRHPAMLRARHPPMPRRDQARPRQRCSPGPATSSRSCARRTRPWKKPAPAATPALDAQLPDDLRERYDQAVAPGSSTTGCGTGTTGTIPATRSAAGCATTKNRSSCSPATSPSTGRTIWLHTAPPGGVAQYSSGVADWAGWLM